MFDENKESDEKPSEKARKMYNRSDKCSIKFDRIYAELA